MEYYLHLLFQYLILGSLVASGVIYEGLEHRFKDEESLGEVVGTVAAILIIVTAIWPLILLSIFLDLIKKAVGR